VRSTRRMAPLAVLLDHGVSVIVEQAWRRGLSELELRPFVDRTRAVRHPCVHESRGRERPSPTARRSSGIGRYVGSGLSNSIAVTSSWDLFSPLDLDCGRC